MGGWGEMTKSYLAPEKKETNGCWRQAVQVWVCLHVKYMRALELFHSGCKESDIDLAWWGVGVCFKGFLNMIATWDLQFTQSSYQPRHLTKMFNTSFLSSPPLTPNVQRGRELGRDKRDYPEWRALKGLRQRWRRSCSSCTGKNPLSLGNGNTTSVFYLTGVQSMHVIFLLLVCWWILRLSLWFM